MTHLDPERLHEDNLLSCSIERVINTTIKILMNTPRLKPEHQELLNVNLDDWHAMKETTVRIWNEARNQVILKRQRSLEH